MRTVEHVNDCAYCGADADRQATIFEAVAPKASPTNVVGRAAIRTGFAQIGALTIALCEHCFRALKALADETETEDRVVWASRFRDTMRAWLEAEAARLAAEEAAAKAEAARLAAEQEAKRVAAEQAREAEQARRALEFAKLSDAEKYRQALAAMLDGSATVEEREAFRALVDADRPLREGR